MDKQEKRLKVLSNEEISSLYDRPSFDKEEQMEYFVLSPQEQLIFESLSSNKSRAYFILQLGYFKAKQQFYIFSLEDVRNDAQHVRRRYFPDFVLSDLDVNKRTRLKQQQAVLELCNYRVCSNTAKEYLETKARQAARISSKPTYIFRELLDYLVQQRIVLPAYSTMQKIIGQALLYEQNRLTIVLESKLKPTDINALEQLFSNEDGIYKITQLRRQPKNFSVSELRKEVQREQELKPLYQIVKNLLPELAISNEGIIYYASLINHYSVFRLQRLSKWVKYLYLLCFVYHRYQKLNDNLITSFLHNVKQFEGLAKEDAKERVYEYRTESNKDLPKAAQILRLFTNETIPPEMPFQQIQAKAFKILKQKKIDQVAKYLVNETAFDETAFEWEFIESKASTFKVGLRPSFKVLNLVPLSQYDYITDAIDFLKTALAKEKALSQYKSVEIPTQHIPKNADVYLYKDIRDKQRPIPDRYEFFTYQQLKKKLEAGDLYCPDSIRFRSLEDDLIDKKVWQEKKETILDEIGVPLLKQPIREHLNDLKYKLEKRLLEVNQRIRNGENSHFIVKKKGKREWWSLKYPETEDADNVNHSFYNQLGHVDVRRILHFANEQCSFIDVFDHVLGRYTKSEVDNRTITACLIAWGTNMSLGKMGDISDVDFHDLKSTSDNFIRLETLKAANDKISNAIAALPVFESFNLGDVVHSSSDGQKFESQLDTFNARHSSKYFALGKGVVAYTLVVNGIPANARIIGAHEHESYYVFDILYNNTTDIKPEIHSTDTHGTNEVNFALLHIFGYQFAPRYKKLRDKVKTSLYGFQHPTNYSDLILKPIRKLNEDLIINEWDNILRIFASLDLKTTSQHTIVKKLSSYARANSTKRALWEYDNIIRSLYLLDYIDSPSLRRNVQTALNRGENYHQFRKAVALASFSRLRFKTEHEQELWSECGRLITNAILYYNACLISKLIDHKKKMGDYQAVRALQQISPIAWQHINFVGHYEFTKGFEVIDLDELVQKLFA